jgi:hypothetical protein
MRSPLPEFLYPTTAGLLVLIGPLALAAVFLLVAIGIVLTEIGVIAP